MTSEQVHKLNSEARDLDYPLEALRSILEMYRRYELSARRGLPDGPRFADAVHWQQCADECERLIQEKSTSP